MEAQLLQPYLYFKLSLFRKILSAFIAIQLVCSEMFLSAVLCDPDRCHLGYKRHFQRGAVWLKSYQPLSPLALKRDSIKGN